MGTKTQQQSLSPLRDDTCLCVPSGSKLKAVGDHKISKMPRGTRKVGTKTQQVSLSPLMGNMHMHAPSGSQLEAVGD